MKTLWLLTLELLLMPVICNSQTKNDEFSIAYGIYSSNSAYFEESVKIILFLGFNDKPQNIRELGPITLTYKRVLNSKFGLGMSVGTMHDSYDYKVTSTWSDDFTQLKPINRSVYTFAPEVDFRYFRKENFNLYSTLGIGYSILKYKGSTSESSATEGKVDFHLGLIGIRIGNNFGGFAELGFGYKGLINFGFNYRI